jgi:RNA recognition motif-containing protein
MSIVAPPTTKTGGSRSQRRNQAKKHIKKQEESEEEEEEEEEDKGGSEEPAAAATAPTPPENGDQQPKKKTKKEKKRERKALEQQQAQQDSAVNADLPRKRARDDGISQAIAAGLRLFVGHLPQSATEEEIRALFNGLTEVIMLRRVNGRFKGSAFLTFESSAAATQALKLDGHVWARSASGGEPKAIKVAHATAAAASEDPTSVQDDTAGDDSAGSAKRVKRDVAAENVQPVQSIFVGNLPGDCREKAVRESLSSCGKIQKVTLLPPKSDDPTVRCGFVDFRSVSGSRRGLRTQQLRTALCSSTKPTTRSLPSFCLPNKQLESSAAAVKLNGTSILGRIVTIAYSSKSKPPSSSGRRSSEAKIKRRAKREEQLKRMHASAE